ncbi:type II toxin-antitoxin system HicA family toxin [Candidatus Bipolaricaulota bacterium]|nr:type II toxin-antitoxin system HicA family toxin [Candidatus Bipolaricaulota bacterium]
MAGPTDAHCSVNLKPIRNKSAGEIIKALERDFFREDRVNGSHHIYVRGNRIISVPFSNLSDSISSGVIKEICKVANWDSRFDLVRVGLVRARGKSEREAAEASRLELRSQYVTD